MAERWFPISTAPKDGTPIRIKGLRFMTEEEYEDVAVWTTRRCPDWPTTGWFPATDKHDGEGDFNEVTHWRPLDG